MHSRFLCEGFCTLYNICFSDFAKKRIFILAILLSFVSCNEKLLEKPKNLIPRDKMVEVLKDLAIVNAAKTTNMSILRENNVDPMAYIFERHGIDSTQLVESDKYYASLPVQYELIYKEVESKLEKEQEVMKAEKEVKDSLNLLERERKQKEEKAKRKKTTDSLAQTAGSKTR